MCTRRSTRSRWKPLSAAFAALVIALPTVGFAQSVEVDLQDDDAVLQMVRGGLSDLATPRLMNAVTGDVDGDGMTDLVFGAPGADPNGLRGAGSVFVIRGREALFRGRNEIDPTTFDDFDLRIDGSVAGGHLGFRVAVADVDGDGTDDIVASAPGARGAVYVRHGGDDLPRGTMVLGPPETFDVAFVGERDGSLLGATLCVGDLDGDTRADIVFSGLGRGQSGGRNVATSDLHVVAGNDDWRKDAYGIEARIPNRKRLARRVASGTRAVHTCAIGDLDDDQVGDLVAAMPLDNVEEHEEAGSVAIVHDVMTISESVIDLGEKSPSWGVRIAGNQSGARFGAALAVGDFSGNGSDDLAVAAPRRLVKGPEPEGAVFLFWGGLLPEPGTSSTQRENVTIQGVGGRYGSALATFDVNGDSRDDVLIGAPKASTYGGTKSGLLDIFLGGPPLKDPSAPPQHDMRLVAEAGTSLGHDIGYGDLDGNGKASLIIRAASNILGRPEAGSLIRVELEHPLTRDAVLSEIDHAVIHGPGRGGRLAEEALQADFDGDGDLDVAWASPAGAGLHALVCIVDTQPDLLRLDVDECGLRVLGPERAELTDFAVGNVDTDPDPELVLGFGRLGDGLVLAVDMPSVLDGELRLEAPDKAGELPAGQPIRMAWLGGDKTAGLGAEVQVVDFDRDGVGEVLIAADRATYDDRGQAGALVVPVDPDDARRVWDTAQKTDHGISLRFEGRPGGRLGPGSQILDFDGDGRLDLAVSVPFDTIGAVKQQGAVHVTYGVATLDAGVYDVADPDVFSLHFEGAAPGAALRAREHADVDGDGVDDLVMIAPWERAGALRHGVAYVAYGRADTTRAGTIELGAEMGRDLRLIGARGLRVTDASVVASPGRRGTVVIAAQPHTRPLLRPKTWVVVPEVSGTRATGEVDASHPSVAVATVVGHGGGAELAPLHGSLDVDTDGQAELWLVERDADGVAPDQGAAYRIDLGAGSQTAATAPREDDD